METSEKNLTLPHLTPSALVGGDRRRASGCHVLEIPASPSFRQQESRPFSQSRLLSNQSNGNIRIKSLNHGDKRPNPVQPSSTLLNNGGVILNAQPSKHIAFNHVGGRSHVELSTKVNPTSGGTLIKGCKPSLHSHAENQKLSRAQVDILVDTVLRNHPKEVHQYRSLEKKELIVFYLAGVAVGICKRKPEPSMLDMVLREKLDEIILYMTTSQPREMCNEKGQEMEEMLALDSPLPF
ncbi:hypothetical protein Cgig2_020491 [Carnegiea gigantea]|uniref:Uncharacterized protein n=1 Tax=Carnegiea gigantea TaxID=171969 RepID=A0A9Q1KDJ2_9CARY|nr:hypothetical protein Cgig2_020491 [Carnegiea gigantea]